MKQPVRWRFLSTPAFGVLEFLTIVSLITCPAPWAWGYGYSPVSISISTTVGLLLGGIAFSHALLRKITFRTHLLACGIVGAHCIALSLYFKSVGETIPFVAFWIYGLVLLGCSLFVKLPQHKQDLTTHRPGDERLEMPLEPVLHNEKHHQQDRAS